jgi:DNA topoisomerase-1
MTRHLRHREPVRELALAAVVELVAISGIRAGREAYARANGTHGAATLVKSEVKANGERITLCFLAKGGKRIRKELRSRKLAGIIHRLRKLPGRRMFRYRDEQGAVKNVRARDVNQFLRDVAGVAISLKDFRTLTASAAALETLIRTAPAESAARRKKQVRAVMQTVADRLGNTPAICRKSYVPERLVAAFERGKLPADSRTSGASEKLLAELLAAPVPTARSAGDLKTRLERGVQRVNGHARSVSRRVKAAHVKAH